MSLRLRDSERHCLNGQRERRALSFFATHIADAKREMCGLPLWPRLRSVDAPLVQSRSVPQVTTPLREGRGREGSPIFSTSFRAGHIKQAV